MAYKRNVIWSHEASQNLDVIIRYLDTNWTPKEIRKFLIKLNKAIDVISGWPELFTITNKKLKIRRCVLSRQISVYFKIDEEKVFIISIFDNRQNPDKLNF
jgi:plasmid stabilization system protein ParE